MRLFHKNTDGATAVEFALILPLLVTVMFGIIEFALIFFTYTTATHAAIDVTRQLSTNQITTAQAKTIALSELPKWVQSRATVTAVASSSNPSSNFYTVTIVIPATAATPTNVVGFAYSSLTLNAKATMQQEPTS